MRRGESSELPEGLWEASLMLAVFCLHGWAVGVGTAEWRGGGRSFALTVEGKRLCQRTISASE